MWQQVTFTLPATFENIVETVLQQTYPDDPVLVIELGPDLPEIGLPFFSAIPLSAWTYRYGKLTQLPFIPERRERSFPRLEVRITGTNTFYSGQSDAPRAGGGETVTVDDNGTPTYKLAWVY